MDYPNEIRLGFGLQGHRCLNALKQRDITDLYLIDKPVDMINDNILRGISGNRLSSLWEYLGYSKQQQAIIITQIGNENWIRKNDPIDYYRLKNNLINPQKDIVQVLSKKTQLYKGYINSDTRSVNTEYDVSELNESQNKDYIEEYIRPMVPTVVLEMISCLDVFKNANDVFWYLRPMYMARSV